MGRAVPDTINIQYKSVFKTDNSEIDLFSPFTTSVGLMSIIKKIINYQKLILGDKGVPRINHEHEICSRSKSVRGYANTKYCMKESNSAMTQRQHQNKGKGSEFIQRLYCSTGTSHSRRSGTDLSFFLQITPYPPLPPKRSPDGAFPD